MDQLGYGRPTKHGIGEGKTNAQDRSKMEGGSLDIGLGLPSLHQIEASQASLFCREGLQAK